MSLQYCFQSGKDRRLELIFTTISLKSSIWDFFFFFSQHSMMFFLVHRVHKILTFFDMTLDLSLLRLGEDIPISTNKKYHSIFHAVLVVCFSENLDFYYLFIFLIIGRRWISCLRLNFFFLYIFFFAKAATVFNLSA